MTYNLREKPVLCFLKIMFAIFRSLDSDDFPHVLSVYPKNVNLQLGISI